MIILTLVVKLSEDSFESNRFFLYIYQLINQYLLQFFHFIKNVGYVCMDPYTDLL